jgi:hypothetical protein
MRELPKASRMVIYSEVAGDIFDFFEQSGDV